MEIRKPTFSSGRVSTRPGTPTQPTFLFYRGSSRFLGLLANALVCCLKGMEPSDPHGRPSQTKIPVPHRRASSWPHSPLWSHLVTCLRSAHHTFLTQQPISGTLVSSCSKTYAGMGRGASRGSYNPADYFPGYLTKLLQNHTAYACDGEYLNLQCPRHSTISVQSAFYGQDYQMCSSQEPTSQRKDNLTCVASTTLQVLRFVDVLRS